MKTANILLVEDNEGDIVLTKETFETAALKNKISIARDGEEVLDFLYSHDGVSNPDRPDLILMDINIPKLNGLEVLETIKNDKDLKDISVIMLTTSSASRDVLEAYSNHVNGYLVKPLDFLQFVEAIAEIQSFSFNRGTLTKE